MAFRPSGQRAFTPFIYVYVCFSAINGALPDGLKAIPPLQLLRIATRLFGVRLEVAPRMLPKALGGTFAPGFERFVCFKIFLKNFPQNVLIKNILFIFVPQFTRKSEHVQESVAHLLLQYVSSIAQY